jgi:hypothetical protein
MNYFANAKENGLYLMTFELLDRLGIFSEFPIDKARLHLFMQTVEEGYMDNYYHNAKHVTDVLQSVYWIITNNKPLFKSILPIEKLALIVFHCRFYLFPSFLITLHMFC